MIKRLIIIVMIIISPYSYGHKIYDSSGQLCLDVEGGSIKNGSNIIMYACHNGMNQNFIYENNQIKLANHPDYCVDISRNANYKYNNAILWSCNSGDNQLFTFNGNEIITNNRCLTYDGSGFMNVTNCSKTNDQSFLIPKYCIYEEPNFNGKQECYFKNKISLNGKPLSITLINSSIKLFDGENHEGNSYHSYNNLNKINKNSVNSIKIEKESSNENYFNRIIIKEIDTYEFDNTIRIEGKVYQHKKYNSFYINNNEYSLDENGNFNENITIDDKYNFKVCNSSRNCYEEIFYYPNKKTETNTVLSISKDGLSIITESLKNQLNRDAYKINKIITKEINYALTNSIDNEIKDKLGSIVLKNFLFINQIEPSFKKINIIPKEDNLVNINIVISNVYFSSDTLFGPLDGNIGPIEIQGELNLENGHITITKISAHAIKIEKWHEDILLSDLMRNIINNLDIVNQALRNTIETSLNNILKNSKFKIKEFLSRQHPVRIKSSNLNFSFPILKMTSDKNGTISAFIRLGFNPKEKLKDTLIRENGNKLTQLNNGKFNISINSNTINELLYSLYTLDYLKTPYININSLPHIEFRKNRIILYINNFRVKKLHKDFNAIIDLNFSVKKSKIYFKINNSTIFDITGIKILDKKIKNELVKVVNSMLSKITTFNIPIENCIGLTSVTLGNSASSHFHLSAKLNKIDSSCDIPVIEPPKPLYSRGIGSIPTLCDLNSEIDAGLCYKKCKAGFHGIGPICWNDQKEYARNAGKIPRSCEENKEYDKGLCYPKCRNGYHGEGPICWSSKTLSYGRGIGTFYWRNNTEKQGLLYYKKCNPGYHGVGPVCWLNQSSYERGAGTIPLLCAEGDEYNAGLCYSQCRNGFHGVGPMCWPNKISYDRSIGTTPICEQNEEKSGALCYPKCMDGYSGFGPFCTPNT